MDNETYLICTYFSSAVVCTAIGFSAYLWLRGAMRALAVRLPPSHLRDFLAGSFPVTLILTALGAFLSVNYIGSCEHGTYREVIADRPTMSRKVLEQLAAALHGTSDVVWMWLGLLSVIVVAVAIKSSRDRSRA